MIILTSFKRSRACTATPPTHAYAGDSWILTGKSGLVSCGIIAPFSWILVHRVLFVPSRVYFPVLCKFWQLCGEINGDFLQEGLCHTHVCYTQSPCPCGCPLLTILSDYLAILLTISAYHPAGLLCPWTLGIPSQSLQ